MRKTIFPKTKKSTNFFAIVIMHLMFLILPSKSAYAQITNLKFESSSLAYTELTGGTNIVAGGSALGAASAVTPIGFTFNFQGVDYTQFSANAAGLLKLGSVAVTNESVNSLGTATNTPKITAWWDATYTTTTASGGGVSYLLSGTAPNRVLTVQWKVAYQAAAALGFSYQVKLYETSNKIEFLYGSAPASPQSASVGFSGLGAPNERLGVYTYNEVLGGNISGTLDLGVNTVWPGAGSSRKYIFTPKNTENNLQVASIANFWLKADQPVLYKRTFLNVPAANRTATSSFDTTNYSAAKSVFSSTQAWLSSSATYSSIVPTESITLDLGSVQTIGGIGTMGRAANTECALSFTVKVSSDNVNWTNLGMFVRNEDSKNYTIPILMRQ